MLIIAKHLHDLDFGQLMLLYEEGNRENGRDRYPYLSEAEQLVSAEQDFYAFLREFFKDPAAFYAVWAPEGRYKAALRLEPYRDGLLLEALETVPNERRKGCASALIQHTMEYLSKQGSAKVYSHVHKGNIPSLRVHLACGFERSMEYAVYADGSVLHSSCTMRKII